MNDDLDRDNKNYDYTTNNPDYESITIPKKAKGGSTKPKKTLAAKGSNSGSQTQLESEGSSQLTRPNSN